MLKSGWCNWAIAFTSIDMQRTWKPWFEEHELFFFKANLRMLKVGSAQAASGLLLPEYRDRNLCWDSKDRGLLVQGSLWAPKKPHSCGGIQDSKKKTLQQTMWYINPMPFAPFPNLLWDLNHPQNGSSPKVKPFLSPCNKVSFQRCHNFNFSLVFAKKVKKKLRIYPLVTDMIAIENHQFGYINYKISLFSIAMSV